MNRIRHVVYYETEDGDCPLQAFIDSREERDQAKIFGWISLLEDQGPNLPRPYVDLLEDGIHELRLTLSGDQVRILSFFCFRDFIILTHALMKYTRRVPQSGMDRAKRYRTDFLNRYDEQRLKEELDEELRKPFE